MTAPRTRVTCTFAFEAAHHLAWHPGRCRNLHGHSYRLDVSVEGPLDANGVVLDFDTLKDVVRTRSSTCGTTATSTRSSTTRRPSSWPDRAWVLLTDAGPPARGPPALGDRRTPGWI